MSFGSDWLASTTAPPTSALTHSSAPQEGQQPTPASSEDNGGQKKAAILGIVSIASIIGYLLYSSRRHIAKPVLFPNGVGADGKRTVVLVNLSRSDAATAVTTLRTWLPNSTAYEVKLERVTFVEESNDCSIGALKRFVRQAARSAFVDLRDRAAENGEAVPRHCVVVYRSAMSLDDEAVEILETNNATVRAAHGRRYHERHCIGFTVDGKAVGVLTHDVVGQVDAHRVSLGWPESRELESASVCDLFRACCVPTHASLRQYEFGNSLHRRLWTFEGNALGAVSRLRDASAATDSVPLAQTCAEHVPERVPGNEIARAWWMSPLGVFSSFAAELRFARSADDSCAHEQSSQSVAKPEKSLGAVLPRARAAVAQAAASALSSRHRSAAGKESDSVNIAAGERCGRPDTTSVAPRFVALMRIPAVLTGRERLLAENSLRKIVTHVSGRSAATSQNGSRAEANDDDMPLLTFHVVPHKGNNGQLCAFAAVNLGVLAQRDAAIRAERMAFHAASVFACLGCAPSRVLLCLQLSTADESSLSQLLCEPVQSPPFPPLRLKGSVLSSETAGVELDQWMSSTRCNTAVSTVSGDDSIYLHAIADLSPLANPL